MKPLYRVIEDTPGCPQCLEGRTWTVEGPGETCLSRSWDDQEQAEWICKQLNNATAPLQKRIAELLLILQHIKEYWNGCEESALDAITYVAEEASRAIHDDLAEAQANEYASYIRVHALADFLNRQREFSLRTFGPGPRTGGVTAHIAKELDEIRVAPGDVTEWIDVILLAFDGFYRHGGEPSRLMEMLEAKFAVNQQRKWGPVTDGPIEHVREDADPLNPELGPEHREYWLRRAEMNPDAFETEAQS